MENAEATKVWPMILHTPTPGLACQTISTRHFRWSESHVWTPQHCIQICLLYTWLFRQLAYKGRGEYTFETILAVYHTGIYMANSRKQLYRTSISNYLTDKDPDCVSLTCVHKVHWSVYSCFRFLAPRCILQSHMWLQDGTAELHVNSNGIWHVRLHCSNYSVQCVKGTGNP